jgi:hypothetical protein
MNIAKNNLKRSFREILKLETTQASLNHKLEKSSKEVFYHLKMQSKSETSK